MGEVLKIFRNPVAPGEPLQIDPRLNTGEPTIVGQSDVEGNIGYFNWLNVKNPINGTVSVSGATFRITNPNVPDSWIDSLSGFFGTGGIIINSPAAIIFRAAGELGNKNWVINTNGHFTPYTSGSDANAGILDIGDGSWPIRDLWYSGVIRPKGKGVVQTLTTTHPPTDADVPALGGGSDGMIVIDEQNNRIYARCVGVWRYAALT
jgi:hypothetical protein